MSIGGAIAGPGGAFFTLVSTGLFTKKMSAGVDSIALGAATFGRWHSIRKMIAGLLFGFATNLQSVLGVIGSPVPSEFMLTLPHVVQTFAVVGLMDQPRARAVGVIPHFKS